MTKNKVEMDELLGQWIVLNKRVMFLTEQETSALLEHEKANRARLRVMLRLYHRYSKLRSQREKKEMAVHAKA